MDEHTDFIATELLKELKDSNTRKDQYIAQSNKNHMWERFGYLLTILCIVAGFLWYLNQYDFTSTTTNAAEGFYAIVDSDGNVVGADITDKQLSAILEMFEVSTNGNSEENDN